MRHASRGEELDVDDDRSSSTTASLYWGHECSSRPFRMSQETIARVELAEDSPSFAVLQR
jgi:hypothetical protein